MMTSETHSTVLPANAKKNSTTEQDSANSSVYANPSSKKTPRTLDMIIGNDGVEQDQMETTASVKESCNKVEELILKLQKRKKVVGPKRVQNKQPVHPVAINNINPTHLAEQIVQDVTITLPQENEVRKPTQDGTTIAISSHTGTNALQGKSNIPTAMVSICLFFLSE
jgi:hypothetical protein